MNYREYYFTNKELEEETRRCKTMTDANWYYVPPYKSSDGQRVVDSAGQLVAIFETKALALECVETHNQNIDK